MKKAFVIALFCVEGINIMVKKVIYDNEEYKSLQELANRLCITKQRVCQLVKMHGDVLTKEDIQQHFNKNSVKANRFETRINKTLKKVNCNTIDDLINVSKSELLRTPGVGIKVVTELENRLSKKGLKFNDVD